MGEMFVIVTVVVAIIGGSWAWRRSSDGPWLLIGGALLLLVLAWLEPGAERGPQVILTLGALVGLYRAVTLIAGRRQGSQSS